MSEIRDCMQGIEIAAASREIARRLLAKKALGSDLTEREIWHIKLEVCRQFKLDRVPNNSEILMEISEHDRLLLRSGLRRKNTRTSSGIAVITVITRPFDCPHGTCSFCPGGVRIGTPQSYTRNSPAAAFGIERQFDPKLQVSDMLEILQKNGHDTSKIEMILLGGTILAMPFDYRRQFVKNCFDALNGTISGTMEESIRNNEAATHRCVGLTIETKPDWCRRDNIDTLLSYGATRVEIGVQSLRQEVLEAVNRGHTLEDTGDAFQIAKDSCYKIVAHMMPGLPKSDPDKDLEDLQTLFQDEKYKPDMVKIYPTLVVEGTALYQLSKMGRYAPYNLEQLKNLLCSFKSQVPPWVRIMRIQREIPKEEIAEGTKAGNLRQIVLQEMKQRNLNCRCIRCREVGHKEGQVPSRSVELERVDYAASGGDEIFLSFEDKVADSISGFLRLRIPSGKEHRPEIRNQRAALVRELHVYGTVVPIGQAAKPESTQHRGIGSRLLHQAEAVAKEFSRTKIVVIAAVGTKEYYRKRGYTDDGPFVSKRL